MNYKKKSSKDNAQRGGMPSVKQHKRPRRTSMEVLRASSGIDLIDPHTQIRLINKLVADDPELLPRLLEMPGGYLKFVRLLRREHQRRENELEDQLMAQWGLSKSEFSSLSIDELIERSKSIESGDFFYFLRRTIAKRMFEVEAKVLFAAEINAIRSLDVRPTYKGRNKYKSERLHQKLRMHGPQGILASLCLKIQWLYFERKEQYEYTKKRYQHKKIVSLLGDVSSHLSQHPNLVTGWGISKVSDERHRRFRRTEFDTVFHLELPNGPVTWPVMGPLTAPEYVGDFAGKQPTEDRILGFAEWVLDQLPAETAPDVSATAS